MEANPQPVTVLLNSAPPWMVAALLRHLGTKSITLTADELTPATVVMTSDGGTVTLEVR